MLNETRKVLAVMVFFFLVFTGFACDIEFKVLDQYKKEIYSVNDELVVELSVVLTHRKCDIDINDSKISADGVKIIGATKWKEIKPGLLVRKLKLKVLETANSEIIVRCKRTCDKEGGYSELSLKKENGHKLTRR